MSAAKALKLWMAVIVGNDNPEPIMGVEHANESMWCGAPRMIAARWRLGDGDLEFTPAGQD
jgi:hypothetical protein